MRIFYILITVLFAYFLFVTYETYKLENSNVLPESSALFITPTDKDPLEFALEYYGQTEKLTTGKSNPIVLTFYEKFAPNKITNTQTAWCSAFMNSIFASCGYEYSGSLVARSWLKVGDKIKDPKPGDIVVFWRDSPKSWKGHVAMYIRQDSKYVYALGGNQSNMVNIQKYPKSQVLEYRRPRKLITPSSRFETFIIDLDTTINPQIDTLVQ